MTDFGKADMHVGGPPERRARRTVSRDVDRREQGGRETAGRFVQVPICGQIGRAHPDRGGPGDGILYLRRGNSKGITSAATNFAEANLSMNLWSLFSDLPYGADRKRRRIRERRRGRRGFGRRRPGCQTEGTAHRRLGLRAIQQGVADRGHTAARLPVAGAAAECRADLWPGPIHQEFRARRGRPRDRDDSRRYGSWPLYRGRRPRVSRKLPEAPAGPGAGHLV